jgi:hypothetical protein
MRSKHGPGIQAVMRAPPASPAPRSRLLPEPLEPLLSGGPALDPQLLSEGGRIKRALAAELPIGVEQDLTWRDGRIAVSHTVKTTGPEPGLREYFFERVRSFGQDEKRLAAERGNAARRWSTMRGQVEVRSRRAPFRRWGGRAAQALAGDRRARGNLTGPAPTTAAGGISPGPPSRRAASSAPASGPKRTPAASARSSTTRTSSVTPSASTPSTARPTRNAGDGPPAITSDPAMRPPRAEGRHRRRSRPDRYRSVRGAGRAPPSCQTPLAARTPPGAV